MEKYTSVFGEQRERYMREILSWRSRNPASIASKFKLSLEHLCPSSCLCCGLEEAADIQEGQLSPLFQVASPTVQCIGPTAWGVWISITWAQCKPCQYQHLHKSDQRLFTFGKGRQQFRVDGQCRSCSFFPKMDVYSSEAGQTKPALSVFSPFSQTHSNDI